MHVGLSTLGSVVASERQDWTLLLSEIAGLPQQERGFQLSQFLLHRVCRCLFFLIYWSKASFAYVYPAHNFLKPLNPILGETYQSYLGDGGFVYME